MGSDLNDLKPILAIVADGDTLTSEQAETAFDTIMSGDATPSQIGAFLMALRLRGEIVDEITAAARIMRSKALPILAPPGAIDVVGTGGDGAGTLNISTGAALVVAGECVLAFAQGARAYRLPCDVDELPPSDANHQAAYWHNHLFNPCPPVNTRVLGFHPVWQKGWRQNR